jgi:hypothetical protein
MLRLAGNGVRGSFAYRPGEIRKRQVDGKRALLTFAGRTSGHILPDAMTLSGVTRRKKAVEWRRLERRVTSDRDV